MCTFHCAKANVHKDIINIMEGHKICLVSEIKEDPHTHTKKVIVGKTDVYLW